MKPHSQRVWELAQNVARKAKVTDPSNLGGRLPPHLLSYKWVMPTLAHGKAITFGENISEKGKNRTRRAFIPNMGLSTLYSRALDLNILTRASTAALREINYRGGLDEYLLSVPSALVEACPIAAMYKRRIAEAYKGSGSNGSRLTKDSNGLFKTLEDRYGPEYARYL